MGGTTTLAHAKYWSMSASIGRGTNNDDVKWVLTARTYQFYPHRSGFMIYGNLSGADENKVVVLDSFFCQLVDEI